MKPPTSQESSVSLLLFPLSEDGASHDSAPRPRSTPLACDSYIYTVNAIAFRDVCGVYICQTCNARTVQRHVSRSAIVLSCILRSSDRGLLRWPHATPDAPPALPRARHAAHGAFDPWAAGAPPAGSRSRANPDGRPVWSRALQCVAARKADGRRDARDRSALRTAHVAPSSTRRRSRRGNLACSSLAPCHRGGAPRTRRTPLTRPLTCSWRASCTG